MDSETQQGFKDSVRDLIGRGDPTRRRALMLSGGGNVDRSVWRQMEFSSSPVSYRRPPPLLGEHTEEILAELLGRDTSEIAELRTVRAI